MRSLCLAAGLLALFAGHARAEPLWIAVGSEGRRLASADCRHWAHDQHWADPQAGTLRAIVYGGGRFVAVGGTAEAGRAVSTTDGQSWQEWPGIAAAIPVLTFGAGRFVAMDGGELLRSESEARFTAGDRLPWPGEYHPRGSACGDTEAGFRFVFLGEAELDSGATSWRGVTGDGVHWEHTARDTSPARAVAYGAGIFAVAGPQGLIETSHDGQTWTRRPLAAPDDLEVILWTGSRFLAQGAQLWSSPDGLTWRAEGPVPGSLVFAREGGPAFAVDLSGQWRQTSDWQAWSLVTLPPGPPLTAVTLHEP